MSDPAVIFRVSRGRLPPPANPNRRRTMGEIEREFNRQFAYWDIRLPPDAREHRRPGKIVHEDGLAIWYLFGSDEKGEYLDFYASHRLTDDRHIRLRESGEPESLPAIRGFRRCSEDPEEDARLDAEHTARNQEVSRMLAAKGFGLGGDEPGSVLINRLLRTGSEP